MSGLLDEHGASLLDLELNIISRILDFTGGSPYDLAQLEAALSCSARTEVLNHSFQGAHCERWARLLAIETDLCLRIPLDLMLDDSIRDGALARISGLKNKQDLNGQLVLVHVKDALSGRWACKLLQGGRLISCKHENLEAVQGMLPVSVVKKAWCLRGTSTGLHGGWSGLTSTQFLRGMQLLEDIHLEKPHRRIAHVDSPPAGFNRFATTEGRKIRLDRMLLAHCDLVFDESLLPVVESFKQGNVNAIGRAYSRPIEIEVDGEKAELIFRFESGVFNDDPVALDNFYEPHVGLDIQLDFEEFKLKAKGGGDDILIVSCALLSSSHEHRRTSHILRKFDSTGFIPEMRPWHGFYQPSRLESLFKFDPTANGFHHVSKLALYTGSAAEEKAPFWVESTWHSKNGMMVGSPVLRTAMWNHNLLSTNIVPILHPEQNDEALKPFPIDTFDGAIALLRRGGGNGFAQKAAAAKAAGAVGCIIFDGDGPLEDWSFLAGCSLEFNDVTYPNPGIPTLLVDKEWGTKLSVDARSHNGACAQILVDSSRQTSTELPPELEEFMSKAAAGEPVHLALLIERSGR